MGSQTHHIELVNQKKVSEKYSTIQWIELEKRTLNKHNEEVVNMSLLQILKSTTPFNYN
jgi:hypothetical protein